MFIGNKKLIKIAKKARVDVVKELEGQGFHKTLGGACGIASCYLMQLAKKENINVKFCHGLFFKGKQSCYHCWVEYNNIIYDITATQFGDSYKDVEIHPAKVYKAKEKIDKISKAINYISDWCYLPENLNLTKNK